MEIEFSGQHDKPTYFKAVHWIYRPSQRDFIIRVSVFAVFSAVFAAIVVVALQKEGGEPFEFLRLARHLITFIIIAYLIFQPHLKGYQMATRLWQDPIIRRKLSGRVSSMGVQFDPSHDWMGWDQFAKVYKSNDLVVLLTAARLFVVLPRSFFRDDHDWKMFQELVNSRVQQVIE
jgi:hypothetical protein